MSLDSLPPLYINLIKKNINIICKLSNNTDYKIINILNLKIYLVQNNIYDNFGIGVTYFIYKK